MGNANTHPPTHTVDSFALPVLVNATTSDPQPHSTETEADDRTRRRIAVTRDGAERPMNVASAHRLRRASVVSLPDLESDRYTSPLSTDSSIPAGHSQTAAFDIMHHSNINSPLSSSTAHQHPQPHLDHLFTMTSHRTHSDEDELADTLSSSDAEDLHPPHEESHNGEGESADRTMQSVPIPVRAVRPAVSQYGPTRDNADYSNSSSIGSGMLGKRRTVSASSLSAYPFVGSPLTTSELGSSAGRSPASVAAALAQPACFPPSMLEDSMIDPSPHFKSPSTAATDGTIQSKEQISTTTPLSPTTAASTAVSTTASTTAAEEVADKVKQLPDQDTTSEQRLTTHQDTRPVVTATRTLPDIEATPLSTTIAEMNADRATSRHRRGSLKVTGTTEDAALAGELSDTNKEDPQLVPTIVSWNQGGRNVYVTGTFNLWRNKIRLLKSSPSDDEFTTVIHLPIGMHQLKFIVDDEWRCSNDMAVAPDANGNLVNCVTVEPDMFDLHTSEDAYESYPSSPDGSYTNERPDYLDDHHLPFAATNSMMNALRPADPRIANQMQPPSLPPHLKHVLLNTATVSRDDDSALPTPQHVSLNHLYACSIKDGVMAMATTHRYRYKYITTVYYKPVQRS